MIRWWKRLKNGDKGFSFVELICTIAIFSIIIAGVGTAMVVSARSYRNGNVELDLQQQAQITSNLLTNLIIDSDRVVQASGSTLIVEKVESGVTVTYQVYLDEGNIKYVTSKDAAEHILAENVTGFAVKQDAGNNVDFELKFADEGGVRSYESDYHVTPRNGIMSGGAAMSGTASLFVENKIILEPGQTYDLNVRVLGTSVQEFTTGPLSGNTDTAGTTAVALDKNTVRITVGLGETSSEFHFDIIPNDTSVASQNVDVFVRRVNAINVSGYMTGGTVNKAGASYKVTAPLAGTPYLDKVPGAWYDIDYVNPYAVAWSFEFTKDSVSLNAMDYIELTGQGMDGNVPYITFKLKQNLTQGCSLRVVGTALHPEGIDPVSFAYTNKSGQKYGTVSGYWDLKCQAQAWRRYGKQDLGLGFDDSYFDTDRPPGKYFQGNGELTVNGYSSLGILVDGSIGINFFNTPDAGGFVKVDPTYGDINRWNLVLDTQRSGNRPRLAYSSPYYTLADLDNPAASGSWSDVVRYDLTIEYWVNWGEHAPQHEILTSSYTVEDVKIKYKSSPVSEWNRTNIVYVTTSDSLEKYKIYYMFDKGWDDDAEIFFSNLRHFVGVVHDDGNDYNDVRCDIAVSEQGDDGIANYIIFSLPSDKKQECMIKSAGDNGVIREIYEYNPLFEYPRNYVASDPWATVIPDWMYSGGYPSKEDQDRIKGCEGTVEFHFVEPNITGAALKTMYCPTPSEFIALGNVYYVGGTDAGGTDTKIKIVCNGNAATYQEESGGVVTTVNLLWNGAGWTAN